MAEIGGLELRKEFVDSVVKQVAAPSYKFKQAVSISTSNAWKNTFFREDSSDLTQPSGNAVKGLPRGANFPQASVSWTEISTYVEKYGLEESIFWAGRNASISFALKEKSNIFSSPPAFSFFI